MSAEKPEHLLPSLKRRIDRFDCASHSFAIESIEDVDRLIDSMTERDFQKSDEIFPYWAQLWPSAVALALHLLENRPFAGGKVLDMGCGLGLTSLAACRLARNVFAFDYCVEALYFCRGNLERNREKAQLLRMHWNRPALRPGFDVIIGSDILYEQRAIRPVCAMIRDLLCPKGRAIISTPGRPAMKPFIAEMEANGFSCRISTRPISDRGTKVEIMILELERKRGT